ncbi:MAG: YoaK family protein [Ferruginibacter sp.]
MLPGILLFFAEELSTENYHQAFVYLIFILSFLVGAFFCNFLIEIFSRIKPTISYSVPMIIEIVILTAVGIFASNTVLSDINGQVIACNLLFAMGLQNSLVTKASQSVVRTTHLTGLFTDLGIELSQLFFYRKTLEAQQLSKSISLKLAIIGCFFFGCIGGGFAFRTFHLKTLFLAAAFLIIALFYDNILFQYYYLKRKVQSW